MVLLTFQEHLISLEKMVKILFKEVLVPAVVMEVRVLAVVELVVVNT
jgi:hypothetical protein